MVSCRNRPEFENLDNAKEFVLSKLKENYGIDFIFVDDDACYLWKDKWGCTSISAYVRPKGAIPFPMSLYTGLLLPMTHIL